MPEKLNTRHFRHRGRLEQIPIYLGKLFRSFLYQSDWKVLPMSVVIAALIAMVVKSSFFLTSEGTLRGSFALTCVAIWNGCFNSIQAVCRERSIIKREHRSGMHITSYVFSHMVYQALLCLAQSALTMFVCLKCGVQFPAEGIVFKHLIVEIGFTFFLVSFASDMLSLFISALVRTTTAAMTVMPFLLIFQLVFSGGFFVLPDWGQKISDYTLSHFGLCCINASADYNSLGSTLAWNTLSGLKKESVNGSVTIGQVTELLSDKDNGLLKSVREQTVPIEDVLTFIGDNTGIKNGAALLIGMLPKGYENLTWGDVIDALASSEYLKSKSDTEIPFSFTIEQVIEMFGESKVKDTIMERSAIASRSDKYAHTTDTVAEYWLMLALSALLFALLATAVLEFIDKDKR